MRRPVKYKVKQAQKQRLIVMIASAVLGVGVVGGAIAAVVMTRDEPNVPKETTDFVSDTESADTVQTTDEIQDTGTEADSVSENDTDAVTEPDTVTTPADGTDTVPLDSDDATEPTETAEDPVTPPSPVIDVTSTKNYKGGYLDLSDYTTTSELQTAAAALKTAGYTAVMVELKYDNGKLAYRSEVKEADDYGANPSVAALTLPDIVKVLHGEGLYITARVCAMRDDLAAKGNANAALMNTAGFRYSDGTSRWISVYSDEGKAYITALLTEMCDAGVDEIMLREYALPSNAATTAPAKDANASETDAVMTFVAEIRDLLGSKALNLEIDLETIVSGADAERGIDCERLSVYSDSITADITVSNLRDGMIIGGKTIEDVDRDPAKTVEIVLSALDVSALNIRPLLELTGNDATDAAQIAIAQHKGYGAYQMSAPVIGMNEK
ncbi:MAG: hypothetical protein IJC98_06730 [Clostridia bacterium]|nr:hypothetical protein [Clostridia bacterium]